MRKSSRLSGVDLSGLYQDRRDELVLRGLEGWYEGSGSSLSESTPTPTCSSPCGGTFLGTGAAAAPGPG